jgi:hypothetical protein
MYRVASPRGSVNSSRANKPLRPGGLRAGRGELLPRFVPLVPGVAVRVAGADAEQEPVTEFRAELAIAFCHCLRGLLPHVDDRRDDRGLARRAQRRLVQAQVALRLGAYAQPDRAEAEVLQLGSELDALPVWVVRIQPRAEQA